jgi:hypothetical protein
MIPDSSLTSARTSTLPSARFTVSAGELTKTVLLTAGLAGTLDILAAYLHIWAIRGQFPAALLKGIAAGAFGREQAMQGGLGMSAMGLFFHFFISLAFTAFFFALYPRVVLLRKNAIAVSAVYSLFVSSVMSFLVLPLSALSAPPPNFASKHTYIGMALLTIVFGLPIVLSARRFFRARRNAH